MGGNLGTYRRWSVRAAANAVMQKPSSGGRNGRRTQTRRHRPKEQWLQAESPPEPHTIICSRGTVALRCDSSGRRKTTVEHSTVSLANRGVSTYPSKSYLLLAAPADTRFELIVRWASSAPYAVWLRQRCNQGSDHRQLQSNGTCG